MRHEQGRDNTLFVHVTLVPWIAAAQELKTKPTQHSVKELRAIGIQPDILLCRSERALPQEMKEKIALFCDVDVRSVITAKDVDSVYEVPLVFAEQGVDEIILAHAAPGCRPARSHALDRNARAHEESRRAKSNIGLVGKYVEYEDSYKSLKEALLHGGLAHQARVNIDWIEAERLEWPECREQLHRFDGILVPGGFGKRGIEGMLNAIRYAREDKVPYFGICLGMQTMVIEFARNVCGLSRRGFHRVQSRHAASRHLQAARTEGRRRTGRHHAAGRLSLPAQPKAALRGSAYGAPRSASAIAIATSSIANTKDSLTAGGLQLTGETPDGVYVEICELPDHPWFLGCQFHPEFKSKPLEPHPLFTAFIGAALRHRESRQSTPPDAPRTGAEYSHAE